jgi:phosphoglycerate-specific signal transduction histidine kinase
MAMDKTLKMKAYAAPAGEAHNLTREQELELELAKKTVQLEEERKKALDTLTALEHMRETLKNERAKSADLQAAVTEREARIRELEAALEKIASIAIAPGSSAAPQ